MLSRTSIVRQRGAIGGIPEQVIAIAVGVLMVSGMIALGSQAFTGAKVNSELANMNQLVTKVRSLYASTNGRYAAGDNISSLLVTSQSAPASMISGAALINSWGGAVTITGAGASFNYVSANIPKADCVELVSKTPAEGVLSVSGSVAVTAFPISPVQAGNVCGAANNTVTWAYR